MPFYAFQCEQCGEAFDVRASIKEKEAGLKPECPKCHHKKTRQVITAGLVIRGSDEPPSSRFPRAGRMPGRRAADGRLMLSIQVTWPWLHKLHHGRTSSAAGVGHQ